MKPNQETLLDRETQRLEEAVARIKDLEDNIKSVTTNANLLNQGLTSQELDYILSDLKIINERVPELKELLQKMPTKEWKGEEMESDVGKRIMICTGWDEYKKLWVTSVIKDGCWDSRPIWEKEIETNTRGEALKTHRKLVEEYRVGH